MSSTWRGFTLIELAIVITVIAILTTLAVVGYRSVLIPQRDTVREAAVATIFEKLEEYYAKNGEYPYGIELNPAQERLVLSNYDAVKQTLPGIDDGALNAGGYNFYAFACASSCDSIVTGEREARKKQFFYFSAYSGAGTHYINYGSTDGMWGCRITLSDTNPAAIIAWKREEDGKWIFKKTQRGSATITNNGTPTPPTTCTFS